MALRATAAWALCHHTTVTLSCVVSYSSGVFAQHSAVQRRDSHGASILLPSPVHTDAGVQTDRHRNSPAAASAQGSLRRLSEGSLALPSLYGVESRESTVKSNLFMSCYSLLQVPPKDIVDRGSLSACCLSYQVY